MFDIFEGPKDPIPECFMQLRDTILYGTKIHLPSGLLLFNICCRMLVVYSNRFYFIKTRLLLINY